ncbi:MAG: hypothetical protein ACFFA6_16450 [Promethearchaeota archaeon]
MGCHPGGFNHIVLSFRYRCPHILERFKDPLLERVYHEHPPFGLCCSHAHQSSFKDQTKRERNARNQDNRARKGASGFQRKGGIVY